jgi:futalosine hydrolase
MRILIVAATEVEVAPIIASFHGEHDNVGQDGRGIRVLTHHPNREESRGDSGPGSHTRLCSYSYGSHAVDVLLTGVGMVATAAWCARSLAERRYGVALNVGVCGSFDRAIQPGAVVHVTSDRLVELGAEDDDRFLTIEELNLLDRDERPFARAELVNDAPPASAALEHLETVTGITVNTTHGNEQSIAAVVQRFRPQVESMEGAAFMYACMIHDVPFAQVRAVSNVVEKRNRHAWRIADAVTNLAAVSLSILETL